MSRRGHDREHKPGLARQVLPSDKGPSDEERESDQKRFDLVRIRRMPDGRLLVKYMG
jgi:hypothetical protein